MLLEDSDIGPCERRIKSNFGTSSPTFQCLYFGSLCDVGHLVSVPGRIGVRVQHPRHLETRYWIRYRESEIVHVARDLRKTTKEIILTDKQLKFMVVFVDQRGYNLRKSHSISEAGLASDWFGDVLVIKHDVKGVVDIRPDEVEELTAELIRVIGQGYVA